MALPQGIQRVNFLSASAPSDGIIHSIAQKGGYQEIYHQNDFPTITCFENSDSAYTGFTLSDDIWSSGRRRAGMLVFVMKTKQFFNLIPVGFVGNGGDLLEADWINMPEWERALRIDPSGTYCSEGATPANGFTAVQKTAADIGISADPMGCWIETSIGTNGVDGADGADGAPGADGADGAPGANGVDGADGAPGADGADGADGQDYEKVLDFWSEGAEFYKVGQDSEYENSVNNRNPNLYVCKGETYTFRRSTGGHPLNIFSQNGNIAAGIVSGSLPVVENADLVWKVPQDAFGTYTYVCTAHAGMTGTITVCCADGTPAPDPTATPVPQPDPTATPVPQPDPTATPVPDPTATPVPEPTATPEAPKDVYTFGVNVADGAGDIENKEACEDLKHPIYTSDKADPMQLTIGDRLWQDVETSVPFNGSDRWYDIGNEGIPKLKVKVRGGEIVSVADCPGDSPDPTPQPDPTATPQPDPTSTPIPPTPQPTDSSGDGNGPTPTATPDRPEDKYTTTWTFEEASQDPTYKIVSGTGSSRNEEEDLTSFRTPAVSKETSTNHYLWIVRRDGQPITNSAVARLELEGSAQQHIVNQNAIRVQIPITQAEGDRTYTGTLITNPEGGEGEGDDPR